MACIYLCRTSTFPDFEDTLSCRSQWTQSLGKAWFRAEELIAKFCPEAALKGRFSRQINQCLWLYRWAESGIIKSKEDDEIQGGPALALQETIAEWRAWSQIGHLELNLLKNRDFIPKWNNAIIQDIRNTLENPLLDALLLGFVSNKISPEQKAVLLALSSQYNIAYNPLAVIGSQISKTVAERTIISPGVSWCQDTAFKIQEDGFISIENCGHVMIKETKDAPELNRLCDGDICNFNQEPTLNMIWERQKQVEDCIGMEQRFGIQTNQDYKNISDLWNLSNQYLYIVDRYFKEASLQYLLSIPTGVTVKVLMSDDGPGGSQRRDRLKTALTNNLLPFLEIKVVSCTQGASAHPIHDRYVFSTDWGASLSSSLDAIGSNALWVFKIEDYQKLQEKYFEFFWSKTPGEIYNYGPRNFKVHNLI